MAYSDPRDDPSNDQGWSTVHAKPKPPPKPRTQSPEEPVQTQSSGQTPPRRSPPKIGLSSNSAFKPNMVDSSRSASDRLRWTGSVEEDDFPTLESRNPTQEMSRSIAEARKMIKRDDGPGTEERSTTQNEADAACSLPKGTFQRYENGTADLTGPVLVKINAYLGLNLSMPKRAKKVTPPPSIPQNTLVFTSASQRTKPVTAVADDVRKLGTYDIPIVVKKSQGDAKRERQPQTPPK